MNEKDLPVPAEYQQSSQRFCIMWEDLVERVEKAGNQIQNMVRILESNGYSRTKAIEKIVLDHSHLRGFSRMTIYRKLPDEMKHKYDDSINMLPNNIDVSNDTFEQESQQPIDINDIISTTNDDAEKLANNQLDVQVLQDKNRSLTKQLELLEGIEQPLNFVREYVSKDNSKIQEYECHFVYKDLILPLSVTLNVTKEKIISMVLDNDKFKLLNKTLLNNTNKK